MGTELTPRISSAELSRIHVLGRRNAVVNLDATSTITDVAGKNFPQGYCLEFGG